MSVFNNKFPIQSIQFMIVHFLSVFIICIIMITYIKHISYYKTIMLMEEY